MTTVLGSPLGAAVALVLPVGGPVDLAPLGGGVLLHLAGERRPAASKQEAEDIAWGELNRLLDPAKSRRKRDRDKLPAQRKRMLCKLGVAALGRHLAEHCGQTQAQAAENVSLITGMKITARQLGDWDRQLLRSAESHLDVSLGGCFDPGREHSLHYALRGERGLLTVAAQFAAVAPPRLRCNSCGSEELVRVGDGLLCRACEHRQSLPTESQIDAQEQTPAELARRSTAWRLRAKLAEAESNYQRVRDERFSDFSRPRGERTPEEHDRTASLAKTAGGELARLALAAQPAPEESEAERRRRLAAESLAATAADRTAYAARLRS